MNEFVMSWLAVLAIVLLGMAALYLVIRMAVRAAIRESFREIAAQIAKELWRDEQP
jgi:hypothetical protein